MWLFEIFFLEFCKTNISRYPLDFGIVWYSAHNSLIGIRKPVRLFFPSSYYVLKKKKTKNKKKKKKKRNNKSIIWYSKLNNTMQNTVCIEVLRPSQPNGVMSSAVSLHNHTFTGQAWCSKRLTSIVHILSPETDNCPSWISGRERMTVENISWSISTKECSRPRRSRTRDLLVYSRTAHPTEPPRPALCRIK